MINQKQHVDIAWINRISFGLERFKKVRTNLYNCRCPICGDSKKNKRITRFYIYEKKGQMNVWCHNCGYSKSFYNFMKEAFQSDFEEYKKETLYDAFRSRETPKLGQRKPEVREEPVNVLESLTEDYSADTVLDGLSNLADLNDEHFAKNYLLGRSFSDAELERLYFTDDFQAICSRLNPEASEKLMPKEPRIVIPFINVYGQVEMLQGRSLDPNSRVKYVSIKVNDDIDKIYGLYEADREKTVYCVEGPFDSLFVENCLATCDGNLTRAEADVYIWDNQPRNKEVLRYMEMAIENKKKLVIWPFVPKDKMDINDLIKKGITREQLMIMIRKCTFSGLTAKMKMMEWRKL